MTSETTRGPCAADGSNLCQGMTTAIKGSGAREIGFYWAQLLDRKTGDFSTRLAYRLPKKVERLDTILVNCCPWCGTRFTESKDG